MTELMVRLTRLIHTVQHSTLTTLFNEQEIGLESEIDQIMHKVITQFDDLDNFPVGY